MEIVAVTFENRQKHINALRGEKQVFFLVLKLAYVHQLSESSTTTILNYNYPV